MLIIVGVLVLLGAAVIGGIMLMRGRAEPPPPPPGEGTEVYIPPEDLTEIVVAAQSVIPLGTRITRDAVKMDGWPKDAVPDGALTSIEEALGRIAREDIPLDTPIVGVMLTERLPDLAATSSDAALRIPEGMVAYALPVGRYSSVAWALQPGDHVDVLVSMLLVDIDEEFQTVLPNAIGCTPAEEEERCIGLYGRMEVLPTGQAVLIVPGEQTQRPRLVTQLTVQDVVVLHLGDWPSAQGALSDEAEEAAAEEGTSEREKTEPLTLIVTPQDAMVLKYAEEIGASIDLILRSAQDRDKGTVTTESVTLQYVFDRFSIELPPKLPYGITPPAQSLRHNSEEGRLGTGSERLPEEVIMIEGQ